MHIYDNTSMIIRDSSNKCITILICDDSSNIIIFPGRSHHWSGLIPMAVKCPLAPGAAEC